MEGFKVEFCQECRNAAASLQNLKNEIHEILKGKVWNARRSHERIKIGVSACPNACSAPQIKDFGVIAFIQPKVNLDVCSSCGECFKACKEGAIDFNGFPKFNENCIGCGDCMRVCKAGAISGKPLFRVLAGGKLGRHPRFAETVAIVDNEERIVKILEKVLEISYEKGIRFSHVPEGLKILKSALSEIHDRLDG